MKTYDWKNLDSAARTALLQRAPQTRDDEVKQVVAQIIKSVKAQGDLAVRRLNHKYDNVELNELRADQSELEQSIEALPPAVKLAIDTAYDQIKQFHQSTAPQDTQVPIGPGIRCGVKYVGINRVGLYAPGGATPLPSTVLMLGIPAQIAECTEKILCTSPREDGIVDSAVAYAAQRCGITSVLKIGGAQAIAAMAFGTETISACDKLFGPGSVWVTEAKRQIAASDIPVTIDMPAGPSEVLVIADRTANAEFVCLDLLAQAEHGSDSQAILLTDDCDLAKAVSQSIDQWLNRLTRRQQIQDSIEHSKIIVVEDLVNQAVDISNRYAPEHLIIQTETTDEIMQRVSAAGSVFLGPWTPEVLGDYCSGTNHVLPTGGFARSINGLSVIDFMKRITVQQANADGFSRLAAAAAELASWEGLTAHRMAIESRQQALESLRQ